MDEQHPDHPLNGDVVVIAKPSDKRSPWAGVGALTFSPQRISAGDRRARPRAIVVLVVLWIIGAYNARSAQEQGPNAQTHQLQHEAANLFARSPTAAAPPGSSSASRSLRLSPGGDLAFGLLTADAPPARTIVVPVRIFTHPHDAGICWYCGGSAHPGVAPPRYIVIPPPEERSSSTWSRRWPSLPGASFPGDIVPDDDPNAFATGVTPPPSIASPRAAHAQSRRASGRGGRDGARAEPRRAADDPASHGGRDCARVRRMGRMIRLSGSMGDGARAGRGRAAPARDRPPGCSGSRP